ncbi:MAG: outer membrane beta-barrel protein [Rhodospirillales bacterium]|nr:outer membrane beta-barrel protein [Rhodospirillales bacterium]
MGQSVRIKRPFLVSPSSERGHRVVIDAIAAPKSAPGASKYMLSAIQTEMPKAHPISASTLPVKPIEDGLEPPEVIGIIETAQAQYPPLRQVPRGLDPYQWRPDSQQYQPQRQAPSGLDPYQQPAAQYQPPLMQGQGQGQQAPMTPVQVNRQSYQRPFYARGGAGFSFEREAEISGSSNNNSMEFDLGINLSGALGIDLQNDFRAEAEMIYIHNDVKSIAGIAKSTAINSGNVSGSVASFSTMANLVYDFSGQSSFTPFVFGGVGLSSVGLKDIKGNGTDFYDDSDFVFAMQFGAGVSVPFDERITIEASYRFFDAQDPEIQDAVGNLLTFQSSYHTFMMALRYAL